MRRRICVNLTAETIHRLRFMQDMEGNLDRDELVERALRFYDRCLSARAEGGEIVARFRTHEEEAS